MKKSPLLFAVLFAAASPVFAQLQPIEDFFRNPEFSEPILSPSGKFLAAKIASKDNGRDMLAVVDLANNKAQAVAGFTAADVGHVQWVNDNRLLFDLRDKSAGQADLRYAPGLFAVNKDGTQFRQLAERTNAFIRDGMAQKMLPWHTYMVPQRGTQDSEWTYVTDRSIAGPGDVREVKMLKLNTLNGRTQSVSQPGDTMGWLLDNRGEPRLAYTLEKNMQNIFLREADNEKWRKLVSFDMYRGGEEAFTPLAFGPEGTLYVISNKAKDRAAVHTFDFATGKVSDKPLIQIDGYDFRGNLIMRGDKLLGVRYVRDGAGTLWFDPAMQQMQEEVDKLLPHTVNLIDLPTRQETSNVLVQAYSDVQPRVYFLYNTAKKALNRVGASYPNIKPTQMGLQEEVRYKARDGLEIPAMLTVPVQGARKNLPMVVLVHGGPYVRGSQWGWDPEVQFLASRGYVVLQPEYRGSTGFGDHHFRAGWKQWGLKMQDDVADGVKWAVEKGYADPKRVCIAGASYGGYATLMGLVNDPDLYKCGIDWVGVTDIKLLYTGHWLYSDDLPERWKKYGMPDLIGDLEKDAAQLKATSPLEQAARIRQPLLLAYGGADLRVPLVHGTKFRDAVKATNKDVEWVEYSEEGHGWVLAKNRIDFWSRVEKFLDRNIGKGAAQ
jgi:dipeptidyl aminopeptidase/acylaminoacyl peptidase